MILTNGEIYMNKQETIKLLTTIQAAYPNYRVQNKEITLELWSDLLEEYSYQQVMAALKAFIATDTSGFAPAIGQIIEKVQMISKPTELSEMEAWALVSRAIRNGYYGAETEFEKLPPIVQKAVGHPSQLRHWAVTDLESIENVVQSNFMRTYRAVLAESKQMERMPTDIKIHISRNIEQAERERALPERTMPEIPEPVDLKTFKGVPMPENVKEIFESWK